MQIITRATRATALATLLVFAVLPQARAEPLASPGQPLLLVSAGRVQAPSDDEVVALVDRSMRVFMSSVREKSMRSLWNHISSRFRDKYSVAQLDEVFKDFYGLAITGDPLAEKSPIFTAGPAMDRDGNLVVDGYYATSPLRVRFHLTFAMEGRAWKLVGINVSAKPIEAPGAS
jgi:hypothetical protein